MRQSLISLLLAASFSFAPLQADVTVSYMTKKSGAGNMTDCSRVMFVKGTRLRIDDTAGGKTSTRIIDLDNELAIVVDHETREAVTIRLATYGAEVNDPLLPAEATAQVRLSGQSREIRGQSCSGYDLVVSHRGAKANARAWAAKDAPGAGENAAFWKAAASQCLPVESLNGDQLASTENAMLSETFRKIAEIGGMPYEYVITMKVEAGSTAGGRELVREYIGRLTDVSIAPIGDDVFGVPPTYTNSR